MTVRTQVSLDPERHGALGEEAVPRWTTSEGAEATQPSRGDSSTLEVVFDQPPPPMPFAESSIAATGHRSASMLVSDLRTDRAP